MSPWVTAINQVIDDAVALIVIGLFGATIILWAQILPVLPRVIAALMN